MVIKNRGPSLQRNDSWNDLMKFSASDDSIYTKLGWFGMLMV